MSYDIYMLGHKDGENLQDALNRFTSEQEQESGPGPLDPEKETRKRNIAAKLVQMNPSLEIFQFDYPKLAAMDNISEEEARIKYRYVEINGPEDSNGIQIDLFDDSATITVPFWHKGKKAEDTFKEIWQYLKIIGQESGYFPYDPQFDRALDLDSDFTEVLSCYQGTTGKMDKIIGAMDSPKKPWWKFW